LKAVVARIVPRANRQKTLRGITPQQRIRGT
jgi:hypothetical protein